MEVTLIALRALITLITLITLLALLNLRRQIVLDKVLEGQGSEGSL